MPLLVFLLVALLSAPAAAQDKPPHGEPVGYATSEIQRPSDPAALVAALDAFRRAVLAADAEAAYDRLDAASRLYYDRLVEQARYTPEAALRRRAFPDQLAILSARLHIPHERLRTMTGRDLFDYGIAEGWIGRELLAGSLTNVQQQGETAGALLDAGEDRYAIPLTFRFEEGAWRIDLVAAVDAAAEPLLAAVQQMGASPTDLILRLLAGENEMPVPPTLWQPPFQRDGR